MLGLYFLFFRKPKEKSNRFLGGLLLVMSVRIGKSVFFHFNDDLAGVYLQFGLSACLLIGPFLYGYLRSVEKPANTALKRWKYHLIGWLTVLIFVNFRYPWESYWGYWAHYFIPFIYVQWFVYLMAGGVLIRRMFARLFSKSKRISKNEFWILSIYISNFIIWFAFAAFPFVSYIVGALSFSFVLYLLVLLLVFRKGRSVANEKYADKKIDDEEAAQLTQQLKKIIVDEKLFKDANLLLPDVAKKLNVLPHRLSQLINDNLGSSYTAYINGHRIEEAKKLIATNDQFTFEAIGYECGFNSSSTFYSTFKKHTGTTPARYKKKKTSKNS